MKYTVVSYSNYKYHHHQTNLLRYVTDLGIFQPSSFYTEGWLKTQEFYRENKVILDMSRGAGYWLWKPYVILETIKTIGDGDVVFYLDCGDAFRKELVEYTRPILEKETCLLLGGSYQQQHWTKRDCFYYMGCDTPQYTNVTQLEAGIQFWKKTSKTIEVLEEQIKWCQDYRIVTDADNECGLPNYNNFQDHRHDQSVLTNLFVKHKLSVDSTQHQTPYNKMRNFIKCNV